MKTIILGLIGTIVGLVFVAGFALLMGLPVMWLWDAVIPDLFGLKTITFWQAIGLLLLTGILVRSGSASTSSK